MSYRVQLTSKSRPATIAIQGAGLAGCAAAVALCRRRNDVQVQVLEAQREDSSSSDIAEYQMMPRSAAPLLLELGMAVPDRDAASSSVVQGAAGSEELLAAWSSPELRPGEAPFSSWGGVLPVQSRDLLRSLQRAAREAGAGVRFGVSQEQAAEYLATADWCVDASGRGARLALERGATLQRGDRLVAVGTICCTDSADEDSPAELGGPEGEPEACVADAHTVEACELGWWYHARTTSAGKSRHTVLLFTDLDLLVAHRLGENQVWKSRLAASQHLAGLAETLHLPHRLSRLAARNQWLRRVSGDRWLAVGDAALAFDPSTSSPAHRALRSGLIAGFALDDLVWARQHGNQIAEKRAHRKLAALHEAQLERLLSERRDQYAQVTRYAEGVFWARRQQEAEGQLRRGTGSDRSALAARFSPRRHSLLRSAQ